MANMLALFASALLFGAAALAAPAADPKDYGALPTVSDAEISPDGQTVAQIQSANGVRAIAFYDLAGEKTPLGVELGDVDSSGLVWAGPNHVVATVSASRTFAWGHGLETHEFWRKIAVDRRTGKFVYLFSGATRFNYFYGAGEILARLAGDPDHILAGHYSEHGDYSIYKVNLNTGKEQMYARGDDGTVDWIVDAAGAPAVRIDYDAREEERRFYKPADVHGGWALASAVPEKLEDDVQAIAYGLADDSGKLIHLAMNRDGYRGLYAFDIDKGEIVSDVFAASGFDLDGAVVNPGSVSVVGARYVDDFTRTHFLVPGLAKIQRDLEAAVPGGHPVITSWADDFSRFLVRISYNDHPDQFFLFDTAKKSFAMLSASYGALDGRVVAAKEKYDYVASDGLRIPGYLTIPANAPTKNAPMIVLPHGGPWARDDQAFDWWAFFYAARGYVVYQPNFRGSSGFGEEFRFAGNGEWGRRMQDDVTEGVNKLIADGIADPARICIVGASYGGYAALAGATMTPHLYACAVSVNGVSNVPQLLADRSFEGEENEYWKKRVGSRFDQDTMKGINPVNLVTSATPPIMLIHAEHDIVVSSGQSRIMRNALERMRAEHEFVIMKGEDHWLSTSAARTEVLSRSIDFIDKHIGK